MLDGKPISGATAASYTPIESDEGHSLTVNVTFNDAGNTETASASAGVVQAGVADTPTLSTPANQTTTENSGAITLTNLSVTVAAGASGDTINVTLSVKDGTLALASTTNLSVSANGSTGTLT